MGDIGLLKQGWNWLLSRKGTVTRAQIAASSARDGLAIFMDRHWPTLYRSSVRLWRLMQMLSLRWMDCFFGGIWSSINLGSTANLVTMWGGFLSLTSLTCVLGALLMLGAAGASIHFLGYTPGLLIMITFGTLIMWIYSKLGFTVMLIIVGGYLLSLCHAWPIKFISVAFSVYRVYMHSGWLGIFLSLNLAFISDNLLNKFFPVHDSAPQENKSEGSREPGSFAEVLSGGYNFFTTPDTFAEVLSGGYDFFTNHEDESFTSSCKCSSSSSSVSVEKDTEVSSGGYNLFATHKDEISTSSCKSSNTFSSVMVEKSSPRINVVKSDRVSLDEMKRIMSSSNHYEALGFHQDKEIDQSTLRKEYHKKAMLVHPDKNMGRPLAAESFKKLQCAYEVLSDRVKRKSYDEQLRKEESRSVCEKPCGTPQEYGDYRSEESRRVECMKCRNSHLWICTTRSKARARWCQVCHLQHPAKDGDGWVEYEYLNVYSGTEKLEIPRAFVCAESKIFDVSEWATCQGIACQANTHGPSFHVKMVWLDTRTRQRSNPSKFKWVLDVEMISTG